MPDLRLMLNRPCRAVEGNSGSRGACSCSIDTAAQTGQQQLQQHSKIRTCT
jgi:hypothetical protein